MVVVVAPYKEIGCILQAKLARVPVRLSDLEMVASTCFPLHSKHDFRKIGVEGIDLRQVRP